MVMEVAGPLTEIHHGLLINKNMIVTIVQYIGGYHHCVMSLLQRLSECIVEADYRRCSFFFNLPDDELSIISKYLFGSTGNNSLILSGRPRLPSLRMVTLLS